ncbi:hypothetical protein D3C71_1642060 [compost metagenome]
MAPPGTVAAGQGIGLSRCEEAGQRALHHANGHQQPGIVGDGCEPLAERQRQQRTNDHRLVPGAVAQATPRGRQEHGREHRAGIDECR